MTRARRAAHLLLLTLLLSTSLAACSPEGVRTEGGPLREIPDHGYGGVTVSVGRTFTDGFDILSIEGPETVTIEKVELLDPSPGIELVSAELAGSARSVGGVFQFDASYPPSAPGLGPLVDAAGAELTRASTGMLGYELVLGMRVAAEGRYTRHGYVVLYRANGVEYSRSVVAEVSVCTEHALDENGDCPFTR